MSVVRSMTLSAAGAVAMAVMLSPAVAADLAIAAPAAPAYAYDAGLAIATAPYTGFYVGAGLGAITSDDFKENNTGFSGSLQAGYTHQFGLFVVGAEAEGTYTNDLEYALAPGASLTQRWSAAAKARAGVALDQTLLYGALGYSVAELNPAGAVTSEKGTYGGLVFGGGVEQGFGNGLSARVEYLQSRYDDVKSTIGGVERSDNLINHSIKAGLNYRF